MSNRKIDALFAGRVLGWKYSHGHGVREPYWIEPGADSAVSEPPPATTSLDAAWPGVEKLDKKRFKLTIEVEKYGEFDDPGYCLEIARQGESVASIFGDGSHPLAHWLVLVMLLAVGVTQEEIDACERVDAA